MTALTEALTSALLHFAWQGTIVAAFLWISLFLLRKKSANARYIASCFALLVLAVLPIATATAVIETIPDEPMPSAALPANHLVSAPTASTTVKSIGVAWQSYARRSQSWILTIWSAGVLLFSIRLLWSCRYVYKLKRRAQPAERALQQLVQKLSNRMGIRTAARVLTSSIADGPGVVGWLRPVLLLPASSLLGLSPEQLESVIAHELAHIRRHDYLVSAFQVVIETLLFYHPAVWWTSSRIRQERELCCDDLAVRACGDAISYARALAKLERLRVVKPSIVLGAADGGLLYRIQRIIGEKTMEYGPSKLSGILVTSLAVAGIALNLNWMRAEGRAQESPTKTALPSQSEPFSVTTSLNTGVSVNLGAGAIIHRTNVEYPEAAIEKAIQGTVTVEATLDSTGNVIDARVLSGPPELRKASLQSVLQWHFVADSAVNTRQVQITFDLAAARQNPKLVRIEPGSGLNTVIRGGFVTAAPDQSDEQKKAAEILEVENAAQRLKAIAALDATSENSVKDKLIAELKAQKQVNQESKSELKERAAVEKEVAKARGSVMVKRFAIEGRSLASIRIQGLSDESRQALLDRLPVRVGDVLTHDNLEAISASIREFDEHLEHGFTPAFSQDNPDGVELRIVVPGSAGFVGMLPSKILLAPSTRKP